MTMKINLKKNQNSVIKSLHNSNFISILKFQSSRTVAAVAAAPHDGVVRFESMLRN